MSSSSSLSQYAPQARSLFDNMRTPSSILASAIVAIGLANPLPIKGQDEDESRPRKCMRALYSAVSVLSLANELLTVVWASISSNKLIEMDIEPAEGVLALLKRDFELEWAAANFHFVIGIIGFMFLSGTRMYFHTDGNVLGRSLAGLALSALMLMISIVNRGIAAGSGDGVGYGSSVVDLGCTYFKLLWRRAINVKQFGLLELGSIILCIASLSGVVSAVFLRSQGMGSAAKED